MHRNVRRIAKNAADLKHGFCSETCKHSLRCGHLCSLPCHWPNTSHNKKCGIELDSPCGWHGGKISCNHLFKNASGAMDIHSALREYKCPQTVQSILPCGHALQMACWKHLKMTSGELSWPACLEPSPLPYTFPVCGHTLPVTCQELVNYSKNPSLVKCQVDDTYHPDCSHEKAMKCWRRIQFESGTQTFVCDTLQLVVFPRCGHEHSVPCSVAQALNKWTGRSCDEVGKVVEGTAYGQQDFTCKKPVILVRKCGHEQRLPCSTAFLRLGALGPCRELVKTRHPVCGHPCSIPCRYMPAIEGRDIPEELAEIREGDFQRLDALPTGVPKCMSPVKLIRNCGHTQVMECWSE